MKALVTLGNPVIPHNPYSSYVTATAVDSVRANGIPICVQGDITTVHSRGIIDPHVDVLISTAVTVRVKGIPVILDLDPTNRGGVCTSGRSVSGK